MTVSRQYAQICWLSILFPESIHLKRAKYSKYGGSRSIPGGAPYSTLNKSAIRHTPYGVAQNLVKPHFKTPGVAIFWTSQMGFGLNLTNCIGSMATPLELILSTWQVSECILSSGGDCRLAEASCVLLGQNGTS